MGLGAVRILMHQTYASIANKEDVRASKKEFRKSSSRDRKKRSLLKMAK